MKFSKFFSSLQEAPWYREFLNPVINEIENNTNLLDIGTGSGKMLEILYNEKNVNCVGTDTNSDMLEEARIKLKDTNVKLHLTPPGEALPIEQKTFEYVTICSVLFHLKKEDIDSMLKDYLQLLKGGGKIIILTPTGKGNVMSLSNHYFSLKNYGIYIWYKATKKRAKLWSKNQYLNQYAIDHKLKYEAKTVMNGFAVLEVLNQ